MGNCHSRPTKVTNFCDEKTKDNVATIAPDGSILLNDMNIKQQPSDDDYRPISSCAVIDFRPISQLTLTERQRHLIKSHWSETIMSQRPDIFHRTILNSIQKSPKLNEIIACQMYCYRDLTKWPKLDKIATGTRNFFAEQIVQNNLQEDQLSIAAQNLGAIHAGYARFGFKPHFLDIWQQSLMQCLDALKIDNIDDKKEFLEAWKIITSYITEWMITSFTIEKAKSSNTNHLTDKTDMDGQMKEIDEEAPTVTRSS